MAHPETLIRGDVEARYQDALRHRGSAGGCILDVGGSIDFPMRDSTRDVVSLNLLHEAHARIPNVYGDGTYLPLRMKVFLCDCSRCIGAHCT